MTKRRQTSNENWRSHSEAEVLLQLYAAALLDAPESERDTIGYSELRGAVGMLLYLRCDLREPELPEPKGRSARERISTRRVECILQIEAAKFLNGAGD